MPDDGDEKVKPTAQAAAPAARRAVRVERAPDAAAPASDSVTEIQKRMLEIEQQLTDLRADSGNKLSKAEFEQSWTELVALKDRLHERMDKLLAAGAALGDSGEVVVEHAENDDYKLGFWG